MFEWGFLNFFDFGNYTRTHVILSKKLAPTNCNSLRVEAITDIHTAVFIPYNITNNVYGLNDVGKRENIIGSGRTNHFSSIVQVVTHSMWNGKCV